MKIVPLFLSILLLTSLLLSDQAETKNPSVLIQTEMGDITVEVFVDKAPITANNFLLYVDEGYYDGSTFFRLVTMNNQPNDKVRIEVIQGGQVSMDKSFPPIGHETTRQTGILHKHGTISMARSNPGTARSSFFICINDQPELDYEGQRNPDQQGFAAFGQVRAGMDIVKKIQQIPLKGQYLPRDKLVKIVKVRRIE